MAILIEIVHDICQGECVAGNGGRARNVPSPCPRKTETSSDAEFATARSALPSMFEIAGNDLLRPGDRLEASPLERAGRPPAPSRIETFLVFGPQQSLLLTARSSRPSMLKSAAVTEGVWPVA